MTLPLCNEKQKIAAAFGRAASRYDGLAHYQQQSGRTLLSLLDEAQGERRLHHPLKVLDAGCGTGFFSQIIEFRGDEVTALDLSNEMLNIAASKNAASHYLCADMESLPIRDESFDLVFSNLSIQWCKNLNGTLNELYRVTKRGGVIAFTTLGENSLSELSQAWQQFDGVSHVNTFLSDQNIAESCQMWRCKLKKQADTLYFPHIHALLNSLKGIGATHLTDGRKKGLITRQHLQQLASVYPLTDKGLPLTYQTIFGILYRD